MLSKVNVFAWCQIELTSFETPDSSMLMASNAKFATYALLTTHLFKPPE